MSDRVEAMRARHGEEAAATEPPPPAVIRSALVEVLLDDLAAAMPAPLAARVRAADSAGTAVDWLSAGAVYRAVADDPYLVRQFLAHVADDPHAAGVTLTRALASKREPPPRDAAWHRRDRLGLALQLAAAALVLAARLALFGTLASLIRPSPTPLARADVVGSLFGLDLLAAAHRGGLAAAGWLVLAALWAGLEASPVPRLLEGLRRLPARLRGEPPPLPWRADAFDVLWRVQGVLVLIVVMAALCQTLSTAATASLESLP